VAWRGAGYADPSTLQEDTMDDLKVRDEGSVDTTDDVAEQELVEDELLVEEISIDGMCGVY
jgi:mycofactocin precursor